MAGGAYKFQSDFAKKHQAKGRDEGRAEGEAKGRAEAVLAVLEAEVLAYPPRLEVAFSHA